MAFLLKKSTIASHFRCHSQVLPISFNAWINNNYHFSYARNLFLRNQKTECLPSFPHRRFHVEPGAREKALLAEDSTLKPFKSYKKSVKQLRKIGNALTVVVVAGCFYEVYVRAVS